MKLIFLTLIPAILFFGCKHDDSVISKPNIQTKIIFVKEVKLNPYSNDATNSIAAANSKFLVLNADWNSGNKSYPGYFNTHTWFDELFNQSCKEESFNYTGSFQANALTAESKALFYSHSYYTIDFTYTKMLNTDRISSFKDCNLQGRTFFEHTDTLLKGTPPNFISFLKITQKGTVIFQFKDSLYNMDTLGNIRWKVPSSSLGLSALRDVCETFSGDILLLGEKQSPATEEDFCISRLDKNGNTVWQKLYGGIKHDEARQILYKNDIEIFLLGHSNSYTSDGTYDSFIVEINMDGDTVRQKTFGGVYFDGLQCGSLYQDKLVVTGYHDPDGSGKDQVFVSLLDKDLNVLQQVDAPFSGNKRPGSCALVNNTFAVCGDKFLMGFSLPD